MKQTKLLLTLSLLLTSLCAGAAEIWISGLRYDLDATTKKATVTGCMTSRTGDVNISSSVSYEDQSYTVTAIGADAFSGMLISGIKIPSTVTTIGNRAFADCSSMTWITIPESVTTIGISALSNCEKITKVTIPSKVTTISNSLFSGCQSLKTISLPDGLTSIDEEAFNNCSAIESISIPSKVTKIGKNAFYGCSHLSSITLPKGITNIEDGTFYGCMSLASINIPDGVQYIGFKAFTLSGLYTVVIPGSVTTISYRAFANCNNLQTLILCNGVYSIQKYAFDSCPQLQSFTIPSSINNIDLNAFRNCTGLKSMKIPATANYVEGASFQGCSFDLFEMPATLSLTHFSSTAEFSTKTLVLRKNEVANIKSSGVTVNDLYVPDDLYFEYETMREQDGGTYTVHRLSEYDKVPDPLPQCAAPTISFAGGDITATSETENAVCHISVSFGNAPLSGEGRVTPTIVLWVSAYATADGYEDSEVTEKVISTGFADLNGDGETNISDVTLLVNKILNK